MGKLKDALFTAVWGHLQTLPSGSTFISALNHPINGPQSIRTAWADLQQHGKTEGLKKGTGLKQVLSLRSDLFQFPVEKGHPLIVLTQAAKMLNPDDGLPDNVLVEAESVHNGFEEFSEAMDEYSLERPSKRAKTKAKPGANGKWVSVWGKGGYQDIVWTPQLAAAKAREERREKEMARALFEAVQNHPGNTAKVSTVGHDFKVTQLKKETQFKNDRLLDILERHEDVFEVFEDGTVQLQPGAEAALPDADEYLEAELNDNSVLLPERMEDPKTVREKIQALRIEILYSLNRRGTKTALQELGQEPRVQHLRQGLPQAQRLGDFVKLFPQNFTVTTENGIKIIEIASYEVNDTAMVDPQQNAWTLQQALKQRFQYPNKVGSILSDPNHVPRVVPPPARPFMGKS